MLIVTSVIIGLLNVLCVKLAFHTVKAYQVPLPEGDTVAKDRRSASKAFFLAGLGMMIAVDVGLIAIWCLKGEA